MARPTGQVPGRRTDPSDQIAHSPTANRRGYRQPGAHRQLIQVDRKSPCPWRTARAARCRSSTVCESRHMGEFADYAEACRVVRWTPVRSGTRTRGSGAMSPNVNDRDANVQASEAAVRPLTADAAA